MEFWDVYNVDREKTGIVTERGKPIAEGEYHLLVHICVFNAEGKLLIQQRQPFKKGWPNMWDLSACGGVSAGEDTRAAAQRELFEELGIRADLSGVRPHLTVNFEKGFDDYFFVESDAALSELRLQPEEVQAAKWATREEVRQMILDGVFIPYHLSWIDFLFDSRSHYGSIRK